MRVGSSLPAAPHPHLRRPRGRRSKRPGAATLCPCPPAGASGVAGLGRSRWAPGLSGQRRIAAAWVAGVRYADWGLRHVPRQAGAAAWLRGFWGRRSAPPAASVRMLGRERWLAASPGPRAPARPRRRARAHSAPDSPLPGADAEGGAGSRVTRTWEANHSARGPTAAPPPSRLPPPPSRSRGSRAPPTGRLLGRQAAWDAGSPRLGLSPTLLSRLARD